MILTVFLWFLLLLRSGVSSSPPHQTGTVRACDGHFSNNGSFSCPESCSCEDDEGVVCYGDNTTTTLNLSNLKLLKVPRFEGVYESLTTLDLSDNSIVCLRDGELTSERFPSLEVLDLSCNRLMNVGSQAMKLPSLLELDLSSNRLRQLNFLVSEEALSLSLAIDVSQNSLVCEELKKSLIELCSRYRNHSEDISCAVDINVSSASERTLTQLCSSMSRVEFGDDPDFSITTTVGVAVGSAVMLTAVVTVSTVFLIFVCLKASSRRQQPSPNVRHRPSSQHSAPPSTNPPLPPPQEARRPTNASDIYAEVNMPPAMSAGPDLDSKDYEDGYILAVESVPSRKFTGNNNNMKFGLLAAVTGLPPPAFRTPPILAPSDYSMASVLPGQQQQQQQQQQQLNGNPTEPEPYSVPTTATRNVRTGSVGSQQANAKKKPPVKPRGSKGLKKDAAVVAPAGIEDRDTTRATQIRGDRPRGKTISGSPKSGTPRRVDEWEQRRKTEVRRVRPIPEEEGGAAAYLKVVL